MAPDKFKLDIVAGPSLLELMLAHYDAKPLNVNETGVQRFVRFTVTGALDTLLFIGDVHTWDLANNPKCETFVTILGTSRRTLNDTVWRFHGIRRRLMYGNYHRAGGTYDVKQRTGKISFLLVPQKV